MRHRQPRWDDHRPPDDRLRVDGHEHHGELWDAGERRAPGADAGPGGAEWPADCRPGEAIQGLREHLDRHARHRQVLAGGLPRSIHTLQHHLLVHLPVDWWRCGRKTPSGRDGWNSRSSTGSWPSQRGCLLGPPGRWQAQSGGRGRLMNERRRTVGVSIFVFLFFSLAVWLSCGWCRACSLRASRTTNDVCKRWSRLKGGHVSGDTAAPQYFSFNHLWAHVSQTFLFFLYPTISQKLKHLAERSAHFALRWEDRWRRCDCCGTSLHIRGN